MQEIYDFMGGRDVSSSFSDPAHNSEYDFNSFVECEKEVKRVSAEMRGKKAGTFVLENEIPAVLDENGDVVQEAIPAVLYEYTNDEDLVASVESELDVAKILEDYPISILNQE